MITALQDVQNLSVVNALPVRDRAALTGEVRPLPATPSAIVVLGAALQPPLIYNASGRLESQVALTTTTAEAGAAIPLTAGTTTTAPATPGAPSVPGAAIPGVPDAPTVPALIPTAALGAAILTPDDIVRNPFYPTMAATLYLSAMTFRLQQSSSADLNSPADNVQMVGGVRAMSSVQFDRQGPADDFRNMTRTFA